MTVALEELQVFFNGKEERPLFSQFKVITNKEVPKISERTQTQVGRFKKDKNKTKLKWISNQSGGLRRLSIDLPDSKKKESKDKNN